MGVLNPGARIEMIALGGVGEARRVGEYWADKLAHGAKLKSISLAALQNNNGWKVTIKYQPQQISTQGRDS